MQEVIVNVYESLKGSVLEIEEKRAAYDAVDNKIKSGRYSQAAIHDELMPERDKLKKEIRQQSEKAIDKAQAFVIDYQERMKAADDLNPDDLTDDVKLFNTGVKLKERDIERILARNKGNSTMEQLTLRYAEQNGVELGRNRPVFLGHKQQIQEAEQVKDVVSRFERWINTAQAMDVLNKFFNVSER